MEGSPQTIEAEIAELARQIEDKRNELERANGMRPESKEALSEVVRGRLAAGEKSAPAPATVSQTTSTATGATYLSGLDPSTVLRLNDLIASISQQGIAKVIAAVRKEDPFVMDAFHDALVDRLYEELKKHKIVE